MDQSSRLGTRKINMNEKYTKNKKEAYRMYVLSVAHGVDLWYEIGEFGAPVGRSTLAE